MLCASALMPHSTRFRRGCLLRSAELSPFGRWGPFRCLVGQEELGEFAGQSWLKSSGRELVKWRVSVNALDGLNAKLIIIDPLPPPCSYSAHPRFFAVSVLARISDRICCPGTQLPFSIFPNLFLSLSRHFKSVGT